MRVLSEPIRTTGKLKPIMSSPGLTEETTHFFYAEVENLRPVSKSATDCGKQEDGEKILLKTSNNSFSANS